MRSENWDRTHIKDPQSDNSFARPSSFYDKLSHPEHHQKIVLFPSERRTDLVTRIAAHMASLPEERANDYLITTMGALLDRHHVLGIDDDAAQRDAAGLHAAVLEMYADLTASEGM